MGSLLFDVLANDFERGSPTGEDAIGAGPQHGLDVETIDVLGEFLPDEPGGDGFHVVCERGELNFRGQREQ